MKIAMFTTFILAMSFPPAVEKLQQEMGQRGSCGDDTIYGHNGNEAFCISNCGGVNTSCYQNHIMWTCSVTANGKTGTVSGWNESNPTRWPCKF